MESNARRGFLGASAEALKGPPAAGIEKSNDDFLAGAVLSQGRAALQAGESLHASPEANEDGSSLAEPPSFAPRALNAYDSGAEEAAPPMSPQDAYPFPTGNLRDVVSVVAAKNDDPWDATSEDRLFMSNDARSFARLALMRSFRPPLAVGIFGSWGAGKSFFMRLIHDHVERLRTGVPSAAAPEAGDENLHQKVVQIRFNAWHYAETNLWASLVEHIFQELAKLSHDAGEDKVLGRLSTAQDLTLDAVQAVVRRARERTVATEAFKVARRDAEALQYQLNPLDAARAAVLHVFNDGDNAEVAAARAAFEGATQELGLDAVAVQAGRLTDEGVALLHEGLSVRRELGQMADRLGSVGALLVFLGILVSALVAVPWVINWLASMLGMADSWLRDACSQVGALFLAVTGAFSYLRAPLRSAMKKIREARGILNKLAEKHREELEADVRARKADVEGANVRLKAAEEHLKSVMERLAEVQDELVNQTPANRLMSFIRARASANTYSQHLGLVSSVRRDFEQLSARLDAEPGDSHSHDAARAFEGKMRLLLDEAGSDLSTAEQQLLKGLADSSKLYNEVMPVQRIVLYIDDLDRCPPDKVIDVLQAVHMLLAFKLFVVFVAVDVRWVSASLAKQYTGLLTSGSAPEGMTSASDYLEKIFQIPYWVDELNSDTSTSLLWETLGLSGQGLDEEQEEPSQDGEAATDRRTEEQFLKASLAVGDLTEPLAQQLTPYAQRIQSPRKLLRLINLVRLLRVGGHLQDVAEGEDAQLGSTDSDWNHALFAQAAIATAYPDLFPRWLAKLQRLEDDPSALLMEQQQLGQLGIDVESKGLERIVDRYLSLTFQSPQLGISVESLLRAGVLAQRYSFARPTPTVLRN